MQIEIVRLQQDGPKARDAFKLLSLLQRSDYVSKVGSAVPFGP
jgi:hypothetical protein